MTRYLVQPKDRIFIKGYGCLSFAKKVKTWVVNTAENFLIIPNNPIQMRLKLLQKEKLKKQNSRSNWWFDW